MQIFGKALPLALYIVLLALHFVSPILRGRGESVLKYVNLFFHVVLYAVLMLCGIPLDEVVLLYLFSLLVYILSLLLWQCLRKKQEKGAACSQEREERL